MAYALAFRHAGKFCGVIPVAGGYHPSFMEAADGRPDRVGKFFIMIGAGDHGVDRNRRAARDLEAAGVEVKLNVYEGVGHHCPNDYATELHKAMRFVLGP